MAQITRVTLTLKGIHMIRGKVGQVSDKMCQGKVADYAKCRYVV